jgi:Ca-activated chloride channel family protein
MRAILAIGILGCLALSSRVWVTPAAFAQIYPYRYDVKVELVGLYATVFDRAGRLITGLNQDDFILYDEGKPQAISQFSREYTPMSIALLLDASGSMNGEKLENACKSIMQFVKSLNRGDEAMLMEFRSKPRVLRAFGENFGKIERDLKRLEGNGSTALYDSILAALDQIQSARNRRRAVLLVSDGINTCGKARLEDTVVGLRRQGIELYAIGLEADLSEEAGDTITTKSVLDRLTQSVGGESFIVSDSRDLKRICAMISNQMHNQYYFGYYPPKTVEGEWRTIRLETKTRSLRVVASKSGYYASSGIRGKAVIPPEIDPNTQ